MSDVIWTLIHIQIPFTGTSNTRTYVRTYTATQLLTHHSTYMHMQDDPQIHGRYSELKLRYSTAQDENILQTVTGTICLYKTAAAAQTV